MSSGAKCVWWGSHFVFQRGPVLVMYSAQMYSEDVDDLYTTVLNQECRKPHYL